MEPDGGKFNHSEETLEWVKNVDPQVLSEHIRKLSEEIHVLRQTLKESGQQVSGCADEAAKNIPSGFNLLLEELYQNVQTRGITNPMAASARPPERLNDGVSDSSTGAYPAKPPYRILVVDDEPDIRRLNTEVLAKSGYHVEDADDGAVAWRALSARKYDLLITDIHMPTVTGLELVERLRANDVALPVILMSATLPAEDVTLHPRLQIQATLKKPYTIAELLVTVQKVLHTTVGARTPLAPPQNWQRPPSAGGLQPG